MRMSKINFSLVLSFVILGLSTAVEFDGQICNQQLKDFSNALLDGEFWAITLFDSWGKIEPGILSGNKFSIGAFKQCLKFKSSSNESIEKVEAQYCLVDFVKSEDKNLSNIPISMSSGFCLPATCSEEKVMAFVSSFLMVDGFEVLKASCISNDPLPFDNVDKVAISMLSAIAVLVFLSTCYDLLSRQGDKKKKPNLLVSFSVYTNGDKLFKSNESSRTIACLEGLRGMSVILIIIAQRYAGEGLKPLTNPSEFVDISKSHEAAFLLWPILCVDTFLVIGGFLTVMIALRDIEKKKFNLIKMIVHRYLRYTPILVASIVVYLSLQRHLKHPYVTDDIRDNCEKYWWSVIAHIQNYVNPDELCGAHTWYLSIHFQLFVITPILIYPAFKLGWKYLWLLPCLALGSCFYNLYLNLDNEYDFMISLSNLENLSQLFKPTHMRVSAWLIGMILGYIVFKSEEKEIVMNNKLSTLLWLLANACLVVVILPINSVYDFGQNENPEAFHAVYNAFHSLVWSIAIAWVIFACYKLESGGFIRWILSWTEWQTIGKLSLSMYITSVFYQSYTREHVYEATEFALITTVNLALSDVLAIAILAVFFCLMIEMPIMSIESFFYYKNPSDEDVKQSCETLIHSEIPTIPTITTIVSIKD